MTSSNQSRSDSVGARCEEKSWSLCRDQSVLIYLDSVSQRNRRPPPYCFEELAECVVHSQQPNIQPSTAIQSVLSYMLIARIQFYRFMQPAYKKNWDFNGSSNLREALKIITPVMYSAGGSVCLHSIL